MTIKLIAIDIDGTLLDEKNELRDSTITAIKKARQNGVKIVLCTGRPLSGVKPYLDKLGITGPSEFAITFNGAMVQTLNGNVISHHTLEYNDFLQTEMLARKFAVHYQFETTENIYTMNKNISPYTIGESYLVRLPIRYREPAEISKTTVISKAMFVDYPKIITDVYQKLPKSLTDKLYVIQSEPFFIEMMNRAANKGQALKDLATDLKISTNDVMAIGDQGNDLSMLKYAKHSIAMGNGIDSVKQAATFTTKPNSQDGVGYAINKFVNNK